MQARRLFSVLAVLVFCLLLVGARNRPREYDDNRVSPTLSTQAINNSSGADVTITLPADCVYFALQSRDGLAFRVAYASGAIAAGNYRTISGSAEYSASNVDPGNGTTYTVYLRGDTGSSDTIEVETWLGK